MSDGSERKTELTQAVDQWIWQVNYNSSNRSYIRTLGQRLCWGQKSQEVSDLPMIYIYIYHISTMGVVSDEGVDIYYT